MTKLTHGLAVFACLIVWGASAGVSFAEGSYDCSGPYWVTADYLMWWTDASDVPALVTTSPAGTPQTAAGVLGQPETRTLLGGSLNDGIRSGMRFQAGMWLDGCHTRGLEFQFLQLETLSERFGSQPGGDQILARPFTDANTGGQIAELASFRPLVDGALTASVVSEGLYGWGVNYRGLLNHCCQTCTAHCGAHGAGRCGSERMDFVIGYRGLRLDDGVAVREQLSSPLLGAGTTLDVVDTFDTTNTFHGANIGLIYRRQRCRWTCDTFANLGLGATRSRSRIDGRTNITTPNGSVPDVGGVLALPSNMGETSDTDFTALFDVGVNLGYQLTHRLRLRTGYTFLFWPDVYRAADQIDPVVNTNLLPPALSVAGQPIRPRRLDRRTDFFAHGIHFGFEFRF